MNADKTPDNAKPEGKAVSRKRHRLEPVPLAELRSLPPRPALIKGLLDGGAMSVIFGESNTGKTFLAVDMAVHVALGRPWQGRKTAQGKVVYVAAEAGRSIVTRLDALLQHLSIEDDNNIFVIPNGINLGKNSKDAQTIINEIKKIEDVALVIVDTLARALAGGDENAPDAMGALVVNCDKIREGTGAHVMIIHHSGKDRNKGARGHSSLTAATDTEIEIIKEKNSDILTSQVMKQRDGSTGDKFHLRLEVIETGHDDDGDPVTTCVLVPAEAPATQAVAPKLSDQQRRALDVLYDVIAEQGETRSVRPEHEPVLCVTIEEYRKALRLHNISATDNPDSVRKAISRAIEALNNTGIIESYSDYIWIPDEPDKAGQTS